MAEYINSGVYTRNGQSFDFEYCTSLSAEQKMQFVSGVTSLVIIDDDYYPMIKDMMFDFMVIKMFTDVDTSFLNDKKCEDPVGIIEGLVNETTIPEVVMLNVEPGVIEELRESVDLNIEYRTGIHRNLFDEALSSLVKTFENVVSKADMDEVVKMGKMLMDMKGEFTPEKIIDAYAKTDVFKSNHAQQAPSTLQSPFYEA